MTIAATTKSAASNDQQKAQYAKVAPKPDPEEEKKARLAKTAASKRLQIRFVLLAGVIAHAATTNSVYVSSAFVASALFYAAVLKIVTSFHVFTKDHTAQLFGKRVLAIFSSLLVGSAAAYVTFTGHLAEVAAGVHVGVYFVDSFSFTDQQVLTTALVFHHVSLYVSALLLIYLEKFVVLALISFQELSNPFWYTHMVLKLHLRLSEAVLYYTRFLTLFAYLFVRFAYGLPTYFQLQWAILTTPCLESVFHWFTILSFIGISANNIMKLCKS